MKIETESLYIEIGRLSMLSGQPAGIYVTEKKPNPAADDKYARKWVGREWRWIPGGSMGFITR